MILKGSQRAGAKQMALHLLKTEENEHVEMQLMREVQKRIIRYMPFVAFDSLPDENLREIVEQIHRESVTALASLGQPS
jgi:hypothetical protein